MRTLLHRSIELELKSEGVGELQRAALEWLLREHVSNAVFRKESRGLVEIVFVADLEAHAIASRARRLPEHQRVVLMLFGGPKVNGVVVSILHMQPDSVLVELPAGSQIRHVKHDMAGPDDVERRIEHVCRNGHTESLVRDWQAVTFRGAGSCAFRAQAKRAWFPYRNRTNSRRRRGRSRRISCRRMGSAGAEHSRN